jgi:hypothetical protein
VRRKLAAPAALVSAVGVFAMVFLATRSLLWAPILAVVAALGVYLMVDDRTPVQVTQDDYAEDAEQKVADALDIVKEIRKLAKEVASPTARAALQSACEYVPELFARTKATSPDSLYSTASQLGAHLASLRGVVTQYVDIQRKPVFYREPEALRQGGEEAFRRFAEFALDNLHLVNQGDIATYRANLETVAPPRLPDLGRETS